MSDTTIEKLLTPDEVCDILRVKKNTLAIWRMRKMKGEDVGPDFVKRGRLIFYTPDAVREYVEKNTQRGTGSTS